MHSFITTYLEPFACLVYFIAVAIHYIKEKRKETKILLVFYILATLLQLISAIIKISSDNSNIWLYDTVAFLTSFFIGLYFFRLFRSPAKKKTVLFTVGIYLIYALFRNFTLKGQRLFDSMGYSIVSASVAIYIFMYFHQVLKNVKETSILKEFNFWLAAGYLVYFAGSFIIFVTYYYFTQKVMVTYTSEERRLMGALWGLHNVLLFVGALSLLIGSLWINSRRKSS